MDKPEKEPAPAPDETIPPPEEPAAPAPAPPAVQDPVADGLRAAEDRIRRLERQNRKLLKRLRADRDEAPAAGSSTNEDERATIPSEASEPDPQSSDLWDWLSRK